MSRFSIHIRRGLSRVLLVVFLHYLIGITCFIHSHFVGNGYITHSHYPFSSQGIPLSTDPPQFISLLSAIADFITEEASLFALEKDPFRFFLSVRLIVTCDAPPGEPMLHVNFRAPPYGSS